MEARIQNLDILEAETFQPLLDASIGEGYTFVQKLWDEYQDGTNRFNQPGAVLLSVYEGEQLIGVGGVHPDPYLKQGNVGRIRHVYVMPTHRRSGVGRRLMNALIEHARQSFEFLTLRTHTAHADAFYVALGFSREPRFAEATHWLELG